MPNIVIKTEKGQDGKDGSDMFLGTFLSLDVLNTTTT